MIRVFHGSDHVLKHPRYMGGKEDNDYGNGFYTTEDKIKAESWAALNGDPEKSIVNIYDLDIDALEMADLHDFGVLAWVAEVVANRGVNQEAAGIVGSRLMSLYRPDLERYDLIKGYRADDSYTQVIEAFLTNQINVYEVERLFYKGSLGNQIFLKSEKAFKNIRWVHAYEVTLKSGDKHADICARRGVNKFLSTRMKAVLIDGFEVPGITARYALQNRLSYRKESGGYEHAGIR